MWDVPYLEAPRDPRSLHSEPILSWTRDARGHRAPRRARGHTWVPNLQFNPLSQMGVDLPFSSWRSGSDWIRVWTKSDGGPQAKLGHNGRLYWLYTSNLYWIVLRWNKDSLIWYDVILLVDDWANWPSVHSPNIWRLTRPPTLGSQTAEGLECW